MRANKRNYAPWLPDSEPSVALAQTLQREWQEALATSASHRFADLVDKGRSLRHQIPPLVLLRHLNGGARLHRCQGRRAIVAADKERRYGRKR